MWCDTLQLKTADADIPQALKNITDAELAPEF